MEKKTLAKISFEELYWIICIHKDIGEILFKILQLINGFLFFQLSIATVKFCSWKKFLYDIWMYFRILEENFNEGADFKINFQLLALARYSKTIQLIILFVLTYLLAEKTSNLFFFKVLKKKQLVSEQLMSYGQNCCFSFRRTYNDTIISDFLYKNFHIISNA